MTALNFNVSVDTTDYEVVAMSEGNTSEYVEEDGVDWCAWWAEYAEAME